nr:hypothetical protein BaRGS_027881 [Batillaria attramentaria]
MCELGSLHSARFLEFGFRMLTEGEPQEKVARLSSPPPLPPDTTAHDSHNPTSTSATAGGNGQDSSGLPDMPAFPDRGGPPPLTTAGAITDHRLSADLDMSSESPDGSNLSGSEAKYGHSGPRKQREFIPENRKDEQYWEKRRKNNEAARRSREKRRLHDMVLENRIMALEQDNSRLRTELVSVKKRTTPTTPQAKHEASNAKLQALHQQAKHQTPYDVMLKREPEEESYGPRGGSTKHEVSSHSSDDASDEPLQLTVHKRSSEDDSRDADSEQGEHRIHSSGDSNGGRPRERRRQGDPTDLKHLDPKYLERRRRNNEAARKCRENRKNLTRLREAKSDYLESENNKLRHELDGLQEEMKQLRELLDKKRLEQGLTKEAAQQQQQAFTDEQVKRLEQLEHEHRMLEQEQQRLQRRQQQREEQGGGHGRL